MNESNTQTKMMLVSMGGGMQNFQINNSSMMNVADLSVGS